MFGLKKIEIDTRLDFWTELGLNSIFGNKSGRVELAKLKLGSIARMPIFRTKLL